MTVIARGKDHTHNACTLLGDGNVETLRSFGEENDG